jgi:hypothetical protein
MAEPRDVMSQLLQRALVGDESALDALFDRYRGRLKRFLSSIPGLKEHL